MLSFPKELLEKADKILFISHLAIGDFTYHQSCIKAVKESYPNLKIDFFVDELRRTEDPKAWPFLAKYSIYDWLESSPYINRIYKETYSPTGYKKCIDEAKKEKYTLIVSMSVVKLRRYANLARKIGGSKALVAGLTKKVMPTNVNALIAFSRLDIRIPLYKSLSDEPVRHISDIYAGWYEQIFQMKIPHEQRAPFIDLPGEYIARATRIVDELGFCRSKPIFFLNGFSKGPERCLSLDRIFGLACIIKSSAKWHDAQCLINVVPEVIPVARKMLNDLGVDDIQLFTAEDSFFELPAMLSQCDLIISVETSIMHLANAVNVPLIALMRNTTPEWAPFDTGNSVVINVPTLYGYVSELTYAEVMQKVNPFVLPFKMNGLMDKANNGKDINNIENNYYKDMRA